MIRDFVTDEEYVAARRRTEQARLYLRDFSIAHSRGDGTGMLDCERTIRGIAKPGMYAAWINFGGDGRRLVNPEAVHVYGVARNTENDEFSVIVRKKTEAVLFAVNLTTFMEPYDRAQGSQFKRNIPFAPVEGTLSLEDMLEAMPIIHAPAVSPGHWKHFKAKPTEDEPMHGEYIVFGMVMRPKRVRPRACNEFVLYSSLYGPRKGYLAIRPLYYKHPGGKLGGFLDEAQDAPDGIRFTLVKPMSPFDAYMTYVMPLKQKAA